MVVPFGSTNLLLPSSSTVWIILLEYETDDWYSWSAHVDRQRTASLSESELYVKAFAAAWK